MNVRKEGERRKKLDRKMGINKTSSKDINELDLKNKLIKNIFKLNEK